MICDRPKFMDSPYFIGEAGNWHLKPDAPQSVVDEFAEFMAACQPEPAPGISEQELEKLLSEIE